MDFEFSVPQLASLKRDDDNDRLARRSIAVVPAMEWWKVPPSRMSR